MSGPTEWRVLEAGQRHSAVVRVAIPVLAGAWTLPVVSGGHRWATRGALLVTVLWGVFYLLQLRRGEALWVVRLDAALIAAAGLAQFWLDAPRMMAGGAGWVEMTMLTAVFVHQWQLPRSGVGGRAVVALLPVAGFGIGALPVLGPSPTRVLVPEAFALISAVASYFMWNSLRSTAVRVDEAAATHEQARTKAETVAALRASRAEQVAALHDTVAATLMMVGLGQVRDDSPWLAGQIDHDLTVLSGQPVSGGEDLMAGLRSVIQTSGLTPCSPLPTRWPVRIPADVSSAVIAAVGEALRNVKRHAGVNEVQIDLDRCRAGLRVEVRDSGGGFRLPLESAGARGIRHSIVERMERVGGRALVMSSAEGVVVRLEWQPGA